ncbi:flagellar basal body-associated FliL family protein [Leptothrix sp. BB-4]
MSAAAAPAAGDAPAKKGSKKMLIIAIAAVLLLGGGGAAFFLMKKKAAEAEDGEEVAADAGHAKAAAHAPAPKAAKHDPGHPPTYVALDPFVVNLADRESERYAQIGMTLEVDDPKFAEQMKGYMPAIRNGILMILAHKTSTELLSREGKETLAEEVMRESVRPMGIEIDPPEHEADASKKKRKRAPVYNPVTQVHFSSFIIQ